MRRLALLSSLIGFLFLSLPLVGGSATHSPCVYHGATISSIMVDPPPGEQPIYTQIVGSGSIGGCPKSIGTEIQTISINVCIQHLEGSTWISKKCQAYSKGFSIYWRYARQAGGTIYTPACPYLPGDWRVDVTGGDGWPPYEWMSPTLTMVCTEVGGGD